MTYLPSLFAVAGLYLVAVASPGPNFLIITQLALSGERRLARLVAWGVATGSVIWALLAMFGVAAVLASVGWLYLAVRLLGAAYLIWLGVRLLLGAARPRAEPIGRTAAMRPLAAWRAGLTTSLTNPKSGAFWTSVFATTFPADAPVWFFVATAATIAALSVGWHLGLATTFASSRIQARYRRLRRPIDAVSGAILVAFGLRLATAR
ncbi:threonine/homoserine/homoserine lactone efflux protein [Roseiarcus fermentans]|uniref:Threonine/homoserine/homoserine lactone efflux protein n=1 Tax=Roseiarcus fermentans TaxID=1473586 RepID=A0A366EVP5_9HYPH|nr:LysE family transporter [Roseiarcus fermentans]RBP06404.1 threonine/homoserine/homoserine lactone efflux protein [Roseiarcus fermentans]